MLLLEFHDAAAGSLGHYVQKFNDSINFRCCLSAATENYHINLRQSSTASVGMLQAFPFWSFFSPSLLLLCLNHSSHPRLRKRDRKRGRVPKHK